MYMLILVRPCCMISCNIDDASEENCDCSASSLLIIYV